MTAPQSFSWISSARSDVGAVRELNEDAFLDCPELGVWVVADGMGGHSAGDLASGGIVASMSTLNSPESLSSLVDDAELRLLQLNQRLRETAEREEVHTIGSTVVALMLRDGFGVCLWAGDSRAYRIRGGDLEQITQDHALVAELVEKGVLRPEEAAGHPQSNLVTRAVGASEKLFVDAEIFELEPGDCFVLCSDGLDKEVAPEDIAYLVGREPIERLSDTLVDLAIDRGARDNVTAVCVRIEADAGPGGGHGLTAG